MKPLLFILLLTFNLSASQLILKTERTIKTTNSDFVELLTFDASKYKQIRVAVHLTSPSPDFAQLVNIEAVEDKELFHLDSIAMTERKPHGSQLIETPPHNVRLSARIAGTYKIVVWANP